MASDILAVLTKAQKEFGAARKDLDDLRVEEVKRSLAPTVAKAKEYLAELEKWMGENKGFLKKLREIEFEQFKGRVTEHL